MYNLQPQVDLKPIITMSRSSQSQVASSSSSVKPFCPVCKNAGKSEKEYTSHYTKSSPGPTGVVVCPTILQATCSYCRELGHFKNKCPILLEKERSFKQERSFENRVSYQQLPQKKATGPIRKNRFATLDSNEDSDDNEIVDVISMPGPRPVLVAAVAITNKMSYASVLSATKPVAPVAAPIHVKKPTLVKGFSKCWADYYSSDEED